MDNRTPASDLHHVRQARDALRLHMQIRSNKRRKILASPAPAEHSISPHSDAKSDHTNNANSSSHLHKQHDRTNTQTRSNKRQEATASRTCSSSVTDNSKDKNSSSNVVVTAAAAPKNDYNQHFIDSGFRPQNFIRDSELQDRFEEYPKLRELITLKDKLIQQRATPPFYMRVPDFRTFDLSSLGSKFDVILINLPWPE